MSDPEVIRLLGRLEKTVEDGQKETNRALENIRQKQADQGVAIHRLGENVGELQTSHADLSRRVSRAEEMANKARQVAGQSADNLSNTFTAMTQHVQQAIEPLRTNDVAQNRELVSIRGMLADQSEASAKARHASSTRLGIYAGVIIAMVPLASKFLDFLLK